MKFGNFQTFSFVDVETTGTSASFDRVLEIGIIRVENGEITGELNTLLDPGIYIPPEITMITGITDKDILNSPTFPDVSDKVQELLKDSIFVAHNARFDNAFIKHEFRRLGLSFNPKTLDTVRLARRLYPGLSHYNLDAIIALLGVQIKNRHRAYDDASVLYELLKRTDKEFPKDFTEQIFSEFLKSPSLPTNITKAQIDALPDGPGVYIMYGDQDTILYIGKSVDVKARVLSHFYNDFDSQTDLKLSHEVKRIEALPTAGDLGASLLESNLIKEKQPVFNRALRHAHGLIALVQTEKDGYYGVSFKSLKEVNAKDHHQILGVFRSKKQATTSLVELAKEYKLCLKVLGIEKGVGRCFGSQIGLCNGACVHDEPAFKHNVRFVEAFSKQRVREWHFKGAIGIREQFEDHEELHVIDNWCYLGSIKNEHDSLESLKTNTPVFDWDNYKIVKRFIKKHFKANTIKNL